MSIYYYYHSYGILDFRLSVEYFRIHLPNFSTVSDAQTLDVFYKGILLGYEITVFDTKCAMTCELDSFVISHE